MKTSHISIIETSQQQPALPRVGLILLATDLTSERDFSRMMHAGFDETNPGFDLHINRILFRNPVTPAGLQTMLEEIPATVANILPGQVLDVVVFHCTSGSALIGDEAIMQAIHSVQPGARVITTAQAAVAHILASGYQRITLLAPYTEAVSRRLADYFSAGGLEIESLAYLDIPDDQAIAQLQHEQILAAAEAAIDPAAEALFISCTNTRAVEILPELEARVGKPCFSSNHSTFAQILQMLDINTG